MSPAPVRREHSSDDDAAAAALDALIADGISGAVIWSAVTEAVRRLAKQLRHRDRWQAPACGHREIARS